MAPVSLGRLERVDLRAAWLSESSDFTPWLARAENLEILGSTIGIELELEAQERSVGPFRADILCKSVESGHWVLVENQLERTDHTHLGQLLTYAAGLQAVTIVWVAARFTEEHRATLDWLNEITDESFQFFGLEVELWRIGDSPLAPKFNIVSKPNNWSRDVGAAARRIETEALTDTKQKQFAFWSAFRDYLQAKGSRIRTQAPLPQHWLNITIGRSGFVLNATLNSRANRIGVELYMSGTNAKYDYRALLNQQEAVENEFGQSLKWMELPDRKGSCVGFYRDGVEPLREQNWPDMMTWLQSNLEAFDRIFRQRIRQIAQSDGSLSEVA
jgi:hypothetical protein